MSAADAAPLVRRELLAPVGRRWTWRKKRDLCIGIRAGVVTAHGMSSEEVLFWLMAFDADGDNGLKVTVRRRRAA